MGFWGWRPFEMRSAHLEHMTQVQSALQKQHFDTCPRTLSQGKTSAGCSFVYLLTIPKDKTTTSAYGLLRFQDTETHFNWNTTTLRGRISRSNPMARPLIQITISTSLIVGGLAFA